jgi:hypothetical protein
LKKCAKALKKCASSFEKVCESFEKVCDPQVILLILLKKKGPNKEQKQENIEHKADRDALPVDNKSKGLLEKSRFGAAQGGRLSTAQRLPSVAAPRVRFAHAARFAVDCIRGSRKGRGAYGNFSGGWRQPPSSRTAGRLFAFEGSG